MNPRGFPPFLCQNKSAQNYVNKVNKVNEFNKVNKVNEVNEVNKVNEFNGGMLRTRAASHPFMGGIPRMIPNDS